MDTIRRIKSWILENKPYFLVTFKTWDMVSACALILLFLIQCRVLTHYTSIHVARLLNMQRNILFVMLALQIHRMKRIGAWLVLLANAIMIPIIVRQNPMGEFTKLYIVMLLAIIIFRQMVLPRGFFLTIHLIFALFLTYFLGIAERMVIYPINYQAFQYAYNENTVGILAVACMMHWGCFFGMLRIKAGYRVLGQLLGMILGWYYVLHSGCRSALLAAALYTLMYFVFFKPLHVRLYQAVMSMALFILAAFPVAYLRWSTKLEDTRVFGFSLFSGREDLWSQALENAKLSPWMGAGLSMQSSMHHILVELLLRFGIVAVISFCLLLALKDKRDGEYDTSRLAQISFLACMAIACFESFFTDRYLNMFFLSFLLTAVQRKKGDASQK